jgi:hypothetical protein
MPRPGGAPLHVLSDAEADRFDQPLAFNSVQRTKYYESSIVYYHRTIIVEGLGYHNFDGKKTEFNYKLERLVAKRIRPNQIFTST